MSDLVRIRLVRAPEQRAVDQFPDWRDGTTRAGLRSRYSAASGRLHLWILDLAGEPVAYLGPALPGIDLLLGHRHDPRVPQGQLFAWSADGSPPTITTADVSAHLFYRRTADVVAL